MSLTGLAVAANVFAPVGLADVAFRLGKDLYETLTKFKNAPQAITQLIALVRQFENSVAAVGVYFRDFNDSSFVSVDGQSSLDCDAILQDCNHELTKLNVILRTFIVAQGSPKTIQWAKNARFVSLEQELVSSRKDLESYITALDVQLAAIQGQCQIKLRDQCSRTQAVITSCINNQVISIRDQFDLISDNLKLEIHTSANATSQTITADVSNIRKDLYTAATDIHQQQSQALKAIESSSDILRSGLKNNEVNVRAIREDIERAGQIQQGIANNLVTSHRENDVKLNTIYTGIKMLIGAVRELDISHGNCHVTGNDLQNIVPAVLQIESYITQQSSWDKGEFWDKVPQEYLQCLKDELDNLVELGLDSRRRSRASSVEGAHSRKIYNQDMNLLDHVRIKYTDLIKPLDRSTSVHKVLTSSKFMTDLGETQIIFHKDSPKSCITKKGNGIVATICLRFLPHASLALRTGFDALFRYHCDQKATIGRQLRVWNTISSGSIIFELVRNDDIQALREGLRKGLMSIYDRNEDGDSLLAHTLRYGSTKAHRMLCDEGAQLSSYSPYSVMGGVLACRVGFNEWRGLLARSFQCGVQLQDFGVKEGGLSFLWVFCAELNRVANGVTRDDMLALAKLLIDNGENIDVDNWGLLHVICWRSKRVNKAQSKILYYLAEFLIQNGINVTATDINGQNCIHELLRRKECDCTLWTKWHTKMLHIFLSRGCDPNALDNMVCTPLDLWSSENDFASWPEWLEACFDGTPLEVTEVSSRRGGDDSGLVVVERGTKKLANSDLTVEEWCRLQTGYEQSYDEGDHETDTDL